jgi:ABC-type branched-subunit amino acid transport system substrate-binding protein
MNKRFGVLVAMLLLAAATCVTALAGAQAAPGVTARTIKIGATFPLSGRASYYAPIAVGMKAYFSYINARRDPKTHKRGVNGRQIIWTYYDDGYNPANTAQQTRKLVEEDKVFALFGGLGTEPQQAVVDYLNDRKVPQMFVSTGATEFDANYKSKPYTLGWQPDYFAEGRIYGKYAAQNWSSKKIGVLYQNDDYGKNYLEGLRAGLGSRASNIITTQGVAATDTSVASQVAAIRQSGADVIAIFATPGPTIIAYGTMKALRYRPEEVILNSVSANEYIMKLALASADAATINGSVSVTYQKDPATPKYANDASVKLYKQIMAKYAPNADVNSSFPFYGVAKAWDVVKVLQLAGKNPTRASILKIVKKMNWVNPFLLPGVKVKTSANDPFPVSQVKLIRYNNGLWTEFGSLIDGRGT